MYQVLKRIAKHIIPISILKKNQRIFRRIIALYYAGKNYQCNLCDYHLNQFVKHHQYDLLCPNCGSLSRTRRLYKTLTNFPLQGKVLHFSPPKSLASKLRTLESIDYYTSDFEGEFEAEFQFDITSISQPDQSFNFIICYHILEHIDEDITAMKELYRILKSNGKVFIQTPYKEGEIYEDNSIQSKELRTVAFGQEDHVRIYSLKGLNKRLEHVGFKTEIVECPKSNEENYNGFLPEIYIVAEKI